MAKPSKETILKIFNIDLPHWAIIALWMIGIVAMSSLTIHDLWPIVQEYYDVEVNTQVRIRYRRSDEGVELRAPNLYLCMPMIDLNVFLDFYEALVHNVLSKAECSQCDDMTNHSYDVWNRVEPIWTKEMLRKTLDSIGDVQTQRLLSDKFVAAILGNSTELTRVASLSWNRPILSALVDYIWEVTHSEEGMLTRQLNGAFIESRASKQGLDAIYSIMITLVCEFLSISSNDEEASYGSSFCHETLAESSVILEGDGCEFPGCPIVCARIPLTGEEDRLVTVRSEYFRRFVGPREKFFVFADNPVYPTASLSLPSGRLYETQDMDLDTLESEEVTLTYSLQSSVIEARPHKLEACYEESSEVDCKLTCEVEQLESFCGCRTYAYGTRALSSLSSGNRVVPDNASKYCQNEDFVQCYERLKNSPPFDCAEKCRDACRSYNYQWQSISSISADNVTAAFKLRIVAKRDAYLEFTTKVKDNSEDLISQIGGLFNFYMGVSGLSIFFFAMYLVESGRRYIDLKRQGDDDEGVQVESENAWRWRWMRLSNAVMTDTKRRATDTDLQPPTSEWSQNFEASEIATAERVRNIEGKYAERIGKMQNKIEAIVGNVDDMGMTIRKLQEALVTKKVQKGRK